MTEPLLVAHGFIGARKLRQEAGKRKYVALHLRADCTCLRGEPVEVPREHWTQLSLCSYCSLTFGVRWYPDEHITPAFSTWWREHQ